MNLSGKNVVVTGAGSGIGRATAHAFAAAGAHVAICDIDQKRVESVQQELGGAVLLARAFDVAKRNSFRAFADEVHALVPAVDVVVNNAGVALGGNFLDYSLDDWDWQIGVNLTGVMHGCHFFVPQMVKRGTGGQVVNISSIFGIYPAPQTSAYVASKFAVLGFSQSLRTELAPQRIGVTAICPGLIATDIIGGGRLVGGAARTKGALLKAFTRGAPPSLVARAIVDAVHNNPAVRTVGKDAWAMRQMHRIAPSLSASLGGKVSSLFSAKS
ncbi:MAG TPA: SDR family NAD(P)-dependent oxidoreductase [Kofleriaceae bacterium]|jgi:NAD(P)-dependent dehydrogenase (short-subunit alcohol dehydrogenase family)